MTQDFLNDSDAKGRRVRLRPKPKAAPEIYGSGKLLAPLRDTNGMVFQYQPTITYQQEVSYTSIDLVHVNQELYAYTRTNALKLTVNGQFSVQNQTEGAYALGCIHFLRTVTKMYFGASANAGTPPPVLLFDAYGQYMFNQLPVIVTGFNIGLPNDVDYVPVDLRLNGISDSRGASGTTNRRSRVENTPRLNTGQLADLRRTSTIMTQENLIADDYVWLPSVFNIEVSITVQNTPSRLRQFDLNEFRSGNLLKGGKWI